MKKYIAVIANDRYFGETQVSRIFINPPTVQEIYEDFDQDAEDLRNLYHRWVIIVNRVDAESAIEVARLTYHDTNGEFKNDYIVGGSGYLYDQHTAKIQNRMQYSERAVSHLCLAEESSDGGLDITLRVSSHADTIIEISNTCTLRLNSPDASRLAKHLHEAASIADAIGKGEQTLAALDGHPGFYK